MRRGFNPASGTWQQKWNGWREKRSGYPRFRQALLWVRDIGLVMDVALCMGLALFASPTVLSDHPWLHAYVDFMGGYFGAVRRLSVGALHPQVSQLVFAVGLGVALIPFLASLMHTLIYSLVLDYQTTRAEVARNYDSRFTRPDFLIGLVEYMVGPFMIAMVIFFTMGDLGVIHSFGWINGVPMTKAQSSQGHLVLMHMFFMHLYTSRLGLGILASLVIYLGVVMYSGLFLIVVFVIFPLWLSRIRQRLTKPRAE